MGAPWGWMDFHVVVSTDDEVFQTWVEELPSDALAAVVDVLATHAVTDFDPDHVTDLTEIEQAIGEALTTAAGAPSSAVQAVTLSIDAYEDENDIDGDMP